MRKFIVVAIIALLLLITSLLLTKGVPIQVSRTSLTTLKTINTTKTQLTNLTTVSSKAEITQSKITITKTSTRSTSRSYTVTKSFITTTTPSITSSNTTIKSVSERKVEAIKIKLKNMVATCKEIKKLEAPSITISSVFSININNYLRRGYAFIYLSSGELVIGVRGLLHSIGIYEEGSEYPSYMILPLQGKSESIIQADYTYVNETLTLVKVNVSKVINVVKEGEYKLIVWSGYRWSPKEVLLADFKVGNTNISISNVELVEKPVNLVCEGGEYGVEVSSYLTSLVCYHRTNILDAIKDKIFNNGSFIGVADKVWKVLEWVGNNIKYDYDKEAKGIFYINNPLTTINRGKGVCIDYSVLISAALQSINVSPTYILSIKSLNHAVAAVYLNNSLFILDQHLPPMELQDYIEYILENTTVYADVIQIRGGMSPVVEIFSNINLNNLLGKDSYPQDSIPYIDCKVSLKLGKYLNSVAEPRLLSLINTNLLVGKLTLLVPPLSGLKISKVVPVTYFYNPIFEDQWINFYVIKALSVIKKYFNEYVTNKSYIWVHINNYSLSVAVTNYEIPNVTIKTYNELIKLSIDYEYSKINKLNILIYRKGEENPILGIAPRGYSYEGIKTIHANKWVVSNDTAVIEFKKESLLENLSKGTYTLAIWVNGRVVYGLILEVDN